MNLNSMQWDSIGAELIYIQDYRGKYLAFAWHKASAYRIDPQTIIDHWPQDSLCGHVSNLLLLFLKRTRFIHCGTSYPQFQNTTKAPFVAL
jgi:hypothetical protein